MLEHTGILALDVFIYSAAHRSFGLADVNFPTNVARYLVDGVLPVTHAGFSSSRTSNSWEDISCDQSEV